MSLPDLDMRTVFLSYIFINLINVFLISTLYFQVKQRFAGTKHILLSFMLLALGNFLVFLRGEIPDVVSIVIANSIIVLSTVFLFEGIQQFIGKKYSLLPNYILVLVYIIVQSYFTFLSPSLKARSINFSIVYFIMSFEISWLVLKKSPEPVKKTMNIIGAIFIAVMILQAGRVFLYFGSTSITENYFKPEIFEVYSILLYQLILVFLAFNLSLMYNKRLLNDISTQEEKFSKAFHSAPVVVILTRLEDGMVLEANSGFQKITGYSIDEVIGKKSSKIKLWNSESDRSHFVSELKAKGSISEKEIDFRRKSGEVFTGMISAELLTINNERCILSVVNDISKRKQIEINLRENEKNLKELNSTKDMFFSIIAHDLKSPFNAIIGFAELLSEQVKEKDYAGVEKYAEIILGSSRNAFNLLTNLMDWSRAQTGRMVFSPEYVDIVPLIYLAKDLMLSSIQKKSLHVELNLPHNLIVMADKEMISTVLRNLLSNAIKYTPQGGKIEIKAEETKGFCEVCVADHGIGINAGKLKKLFEGDHRASTPGTENETGTGLGLILCKDFIERHKGELKVESKTGKGSTFCFTLPL